MLTTKQKVLRRFWYATEKLEALKDGPKPFKLLGENIVLFLDDKGEPAALQDRCCHRTSKLSKGWSDQGNIVCGYHGWTYDRTGPDGDFHSAADIHAMTLSNLSGEFATIVTAQDVIAGL